MITHHVKSPTLQTELSQQGLQIKVASNNTYFFIKSLNEVDGLSSWFDDLGELQHYLKDEKNFIIKPDAVIEIIHRPPTKKQGYITIAKLKLSNPVQNRPQHLTKTNINNKFQPKQQQQATKQTKSSLELWVDPKISDYWRLLFYEKMIQTKYGSASVLGRKVLQPQSQFNIFTQNFLNFTSIGVIDQQLKQYRSGKKNMISYQSNRYFYDGQKTLQNQGPGYNVRESVTVKLDMGIGLIEWKVGEKIIYSHNTKLFQNQNVKWVPYVFLADSCDSFGIGS